MDRYAAERVHELERDLVRLVVGNDGDVRPNTYSDTELHVVLRVGDAEAWHIYTTVGVSVDRSGMDGLAHELSEVLGDQVEIYVGKNPDELRFPECGCALVGRSRALVGAR